MAEMKLTEDALGITKEAGITPNKLPLVGDAYSVPKIDIDTGIEYTNEQRCMMLFNAIIQDVKDKVQRYVDSKREHADISDIIIEE